MQTDNEHPSVSLFRQYLRIKSVQPDPDYEACNAFLTQQANRLGLSYNIFEMVPGKPVFIMTWPGLQPELPSILLNSHTDVVPAQLKFWKYDPFDAVKEANGDIYGRGTQDMKSVGIQHLEAVYRLKVEQKRQLKRTLHICFIADEELGGHEGMAKFVLSAHFKKLNIGLALDEGLASPTDLMPLYYGERNVFWITVRCPGNAGHGSQFVPGTAAEKAHFIMNRLLNLRDEQLKIFQSDPNLTMGDVTTVNLTYMNGGLRGQPNVVPDEFCLGFDIRITPTTDIIQFERQLRAWIDQAGDGVELEFKQKFTDQTMSSVCEEDPWYRAFMKAAGKHNLNIRPLVFPGATDSRYIREVGIPAFGFSPMNHTPVLLHNHNEFLNEKIFLRGIDIFVDVIAELASV